MIIKAIGEEVSITTADDLNEARLIRVYAAAASKITITNVEANAVAGSFTVPAASVTAPPVPGSRIHLQARPAPPRLPDHPASRPPPRAVQLGGHRIRDALP